MHTRRFFLRGLGGFSLALPTLPSLLTASEARAQAAGNQPILIHLCSAHGGIWAQNMYPPQVNAQTMSYAGHTARRTALSPTTSGGVTRLSNALQGPSDRFTAGLVSKMNILQGFDVPFYLGHHAGGYLGNYGKNDGNGNDGRAMQSRQVPTLDNLLAWSPQFYQSLQGVSRRVLIIGGGNSFAHANMQTRTGPIEEVYPEWSQLGFFNDTFQQTGTPMTRPLVVDRVMADYRRLKANRRLSTEDRRRVDDHLQRLAELDRRLNQTTSCAPPRRSTVDTWDLINDPRTHNEPPRQLALNKEWFDVLVPALACGATRVVNVSLQGNLTGYSGDWHQDVAHQSHRPDGAAQNLNLAWHRSFFRDVVLELVNRLEAVSEGNGRTLLDRCVVVWTQESGPYTHESDALPIVTFGSAGGRWRTGQHLDFRDLQRSENPFGLDGAIEERAPGITHNQWLANLAMVMGLQQSEFSAWGTPGYGITYVGTDQDFARLYPTRVRTVANERLPWLWAS